MRNNVTTFVLGAAIFCAIIAIVLLFSGTFMAFIDIPSGLFVIGGAGALGLAGYKKKTGFIAYIKQCRKSLIPVGILGTVTGLILILQNLSDPANIGQGMAIALLTVFYSIILYCVATSLVYKFKEEI